jgi:hypothetical protein
MSQTIASPEAVTSTRTLLLATTLAAVLPSPSVALAASATPNGSNVCLDTTLSVTTSAGDGPVANTVATTVVALGTPGQRISRLHLDLEVQERTATTWVPFETTQHVITFTNYKGSHLHRVWTLREAADPIYALLDEHVQMRVYAKLEGVCRGETLGPPLLFGLTVPAITPAPST